MDFLGIVRELVLVHFACSGRFVCLFRACGLVRSGRGLGVGGEGANQRPPSFGWDLVSDSGVSRVFAYVSSLDDEGSGVWAFGLAGPLGEKRGARRGARMRGRSQLGRHGARVRARVCWEPHQEATFAEGPISEVGPLPRNQRGGLPHAWPQESNFTFRSGSQPTGKVFISTPRAAEDTGPASRVCPGSPRCLFTGTL